MPKKEKKIDLNKLTKEDEIKLEIAKEIGCYDRLISDGWKSLTASETGKIGGIMNKRYKSGKM